MLNQKIRISKEHKYGFIKLIKRNFIVLPPSRELKQLGGLYMITLFKKNSSLPSIMSLILLVSIGLIALTGCKPYGLADSTTKVDNEKNQITYNDQIEVEESIKAFGEAIENGDYNTAEKYCMPDFRDYIVNLTSGKGAVTDKFSMAIVGNMTIELVSAKGYYDEGEKGLNYNITRDKPTVNFLVTFEIQKPNGEKERIEGYTQGAKDADGKWCVEGFASGR